LGHIAEFKATDLQLTAGVPPSLKVGNELKRLNMPPLTSKQVDSYAKSIMSEEQQQKFESENDLEFVFADGELGRFRINVYKQRNSVSITIRHTSDHIPSFSELGLPDELEEFALKPQGFILITGPTCQGKTTTLAALVDVINRKRRCNIISLEDPIEFLHKHKNCNVNQREIGIDTVSFQAGLKQIFRQDPDVIVVGEMRDMESFKIALQAAESGHLVMSTLHSKNATSTIERIIDIFPPHQQAQVRYQLADTLILVLSQRLIPHRSESGLVLAYEKLVNTYKTKNLIREGKTHLIRSQMQYASDEYVSLDFNLARLCIEGKISTDDGERHADNISFFQELIKRGAVQ
jgi:twitching motility protein PilT